MPARSARRRRECDRRSTSPPRAGRWRWSLRAMPGFTAWRRSSSSCSIAHANPDWRTVEIVICPGISAMQAAAARAGAPLGHDFCAISLSDLMTPWETIRARLEAAAAADFVVALYNPRSARRPARPRRGGRDPAAIIGRPRPRSLSARNLGRAGEERRIIRAGRTGRRRHRHADPRPRRQQPHPAASTAIRPASTRRAAISTVRASDRAFHRRRPRGARSDHGARPAADRALPGLPLRRLAGAARDRRRRAAGRAR